MQRETTQLMPIFNPMNMNGETTCRTQLETRFICTSTLLSFPVQTSPNTNSSTLGNYFACYSVFHRSSINASRPVPISYHPAQPLFHHPTSSLILSFSSDIILSSFHLRPYSLYSCIYVLLFKAILHRYFGSRWSHYLSMWGQVDNGWYHGEEELIADWGQVL